MNTFLQNIKTKLNNKIDNLILILGNESCDLDSAVSALVYARFLNWQHCESKNGDNVYVPILNVSREDFEIKTEVNYCLKSINIDTNLLIFRDDYDYQKFLKSGNTQVVLVDHHILCSNDIYFLDYVFVIIDHRPKDVGNWCYKESVKNSIQTVGSCCTLIFKRVQNESDDFEEFFKRHKECTELLYDTIILDVVNFSREVNKATPLDVEVVAALEELLKISDPLSKRESIFNELVKARSDVSKLNPEQLLRKDVKIINNILIPSFPMLVHDFHQKSNVERSMEQIMLKTKTNILLMLGMKLNGDCVKRDLAVFAKIEYSNEVKRLATLLEASSVLKLARKHSNIENCIYYEQNNLSASRKQVIPIVNDFLNDS